MLKGIVNHESSRIESFRKPVISDPPRKNQSVAPAVSRVFLERYVASGHAVHQSPAVIELSSGSWNTRHKVSDSVNH